jgi:hypothetical protein
MKQLVVTSSAFVHDQKIPAKYTCDGDNVNPPLTIEGIPEGTKTLVLIADDPDAPVGIWDHWIVWNIPVTSAIEENSVPGKEALNSFGKKSYGGPCPPSGTHRYFFKVYALDAELDLGANANKADVEKAMRGHVLGQGELVGLYSRK